MPLHDASARGVSRKLQDGKRIRLVGSYHDWISSRTVALRHSFHILLGGLVAGVELQSFAEQGAGAGLPVMRGIQPGGAGRAEIGSEESPELVHALDRETPGLLRQQEHFIGDRISIRSGTT